MTVESEGIHEEGEGKLWVEPRCPQCQRFVRIERVGVNGLGQVSIDARCQRCGVVTPEYGWTDG